MEEEYEALQKLISEYGLVYGPGAGHEIMGSLMRSYGISGIIEVFVKANGRRILVEVPSDIIDGVKVKYKKPKGNEKT